MKFLDLQGLNYFYKLLNKQFETKVDKVKGKGLSTNDYTDLDKQMLKSIPGNYLKNEDIPTIVNQVQADADISPMTEEELKNLF